jgi:deferrochelatase/peroxidase EfeB
VRQRPGVRALPLCGGRHQRHGNQEEERHGVLAPIVLAQAAIVTVLAVFFVVMPGVSDTFWVLQAMTAILTPFGTPSRHGTMFVGFSADQHRLARMLARMAGVEEGIRDALTYFTAPVTGAYYFVPSVQALRSFAPVED